MQNCENCGNLMVRADMYDPEGATPLKIVIVDKKPWTCINSACPDSSQTQKGDTNA